MVTKITPVQHKHYHGLWIDYDKNGLSSEELEAIRREYLVPEYASQHIQQPNTDEYCLKLLWPIWTEQQVRQRLPNGTVILFDGTLHLESLKIGH